MSKLKLQAYNMRSDAVGYNNKIRFKVEKLRCPERVDLQNS